MSHHGVARIPLAAATVCSLGACELLTRTQTEEPEIELPTVHVRVCWATGRVSERDCVGNAGWGTERAPTRSPNAVPLAGIPVRICYFRDLFACREQSNANVVLGSQTTDGEGYAMFPALGSALYVFYPNVENAEVDGCSLIARDRYGSVLMVQPRVRTTPVEFQNSHVGELWFITERCQWGPVSVSH